MNIPYHTLVWDFDGTLADTRALALRIYNELAAKQGFLPVRDPASVRNMGTLTFLRNHGIPLYKLPWLVKEYLAATAGSMQTIRLFDALPELLRNLKTFGFRLGVLSSNSAENIRSCLRANGVEDVFEFVVGYPRLLGKATAIRRLIKRDGIDRKCMLYIGDEVRDLEAARKARVDSAAVGWGFNSIDFLAKEFPRFLWSTPDELLHALSPIE